MMHCTRQYWRLESVVIAAFILLAGARGAAQAQWGGLIPSSQFELSEAVQLDQADHAVLAQLERVKTLSADRQWDEAVEILRQLMETSEGKLLLIGPRRYVGVGDWCQSRLAALPPEALRLYRGRVDPMAQKWYERGVAQRDPKLLQNVVDHAFASSYGDRALLALGEMALESGDYAAARWNWERIVPSVWPGYPDSKLDLAAVRARLVLVSILEGATDRARTELAEFARLHPDAEGRLGAHEGKYVELLQTLLSQSAAWPSGKGRAGGQHADWATFAGSPQRNAIAPPLTDFGAVAWRVPLFPPLPLGEGPGVRAAAAAARNADMLPPDRFLPNPLPNREETGALGPLSFHPVAVGNLVLVNNAEQILAVRQDTGKAAWGKTAAIYQAELAGVARPRPMLPEGLGAPCFTMTVFQGRLLARMGTALTGQGQIAATATAPGYVVCLDLAAQGRLLWKIAPEEGWAFEGSPLADEHGVYVAMRRQDIRPQAAVACLDADTGRLRWRRFICGAETPSRGILPEYTHNLLTLAGGVLYCNTNLGVVAAVRAEDGRVLWISLYPRELRGDLAKLAPHWRRELNPCVVNRGTLLVAPADSPRIFALDTATGQPLWQTGTEVEDALDLLGTAGDWLVAGGGRLYWISLKDEDRGRVKHVWPDGPERPGYGRGVLAGQSVLWPTRDKLYIFDQQTARLRKVVDLAARGASGGNLLVAGGQLLIATESELIALDLKGGSTQPMQPRPLAAQ
jgi:outer membrane protein assembly factor BamB